jgi:hypothetical protein
LRRTTSALTTAVLGAALTASMVSAQQPSDPDKPSQTGPPPAGSKARAKSASDMANSQLYGLSASRGARHLMRNGLDYLRYQEYERALKFLREAETRNKELNDAEKLALKQGIDAAQRGLRNAADVESPYALSDRSRTPNGFVPASPATRVAALSDRTTPSKRRGKPKSTIAQRQLESDGDDEGQPIRLASGELPINTPPGAMNSKSGQGEVPNDDDLTVPGARSPRNTPEIPQIPMIAKLPDLTETGGPERGLPPASVAPRARTEAMQRTPAVAHQSSTPAEMDPADLKLQTDSRAMPPSRASRTDRATESDQVSSDPVVVAGPLVEGASDGEQPSQAVARRAPRTTGRRAAVSDPAAARTIATLGPPRSFPAVDDLPPLPADLGGATASGGPRPSNRREVAQAATVTARPVWPSDDDLPPLPADLGRAAPTAQPATIPPAHVTIAPATEPASAPAPAPTPSPDQAPALAPTAAPSAAPNEQPSAPGELDLDRPIRVPAEAPSPAPGSADAHALPSGSGLDPENPKVETAPAPAPTEGSVAQVIAPVPAHAEAPLPEPASVEVSPVPGASASAASAEPVSQPMPATNPNLAPQSPETPATSTESNAQPGSLPAAIPDRPAAATSDIFIPDRATPPTTLRPDLMREVEKIARNQEDEMKRQAQNPQPPAGAAPRDTMASDLRTQTQLDISRAPSPAEARPIKAIPVPEDWVPLPPRNWTAQRKYWAAAATCHLPLYFQDPVLERYGHSVEQFVGPLGRFLTYPVDDPTQSTQRNQMLQPFFSAGLMGLQIIAWPYNLIMDPPWEAQYDLGYYRPGDSIPTDTYWLPLHGYGPPLRGSNY